MDWKLKTGRFLFKYRSLTPLPLIVIVLIFVRPTAGVGHALLLNIGGLVVALLGEAVRIFAVGYAHTGTSGRESYLRAEALNTSGIYSLVRNPLYIGNLLIYTGLLAVFANLPALLLFDTFLFIQYYFIILSEEHYLKITHGSRYESYCREVNRIFPRVNKYRPPDLPFNLRKVIQKENDSLFNLLMMYLLLLAYKERLHLGHFRNSILFVSAVGVLVIVYIGIKIWKRANSKG